MVGVDGKQKREGAMSVGSSEKLKGEMDNNIPMNTFS